jgi:hypothetical protein
LGAISISEKKAGYDVEKEACRTIGVMREKIWQKKKKQM